MRQALIAITFAVWALWSGTTPAAALSCTGTFTMAFGDINVLDANSETTSSNVAVNCVGGTPLTTVRACVVIEATRQMTWAGGGGAISYGLSHISAGGTSWPSLISTTSPSTTLVLGLGGSGSGSIPIYGIVSSPQASAPTQLTNTLYSDAPLVTVTSDLSALNPNCSTVTANSISLPAVVNADYLPACYLTTHPLSFGTIASTLTQVDASTTIDANCSNLSLFTIALDYGANGGVDPTVRYMKAGNNTLRYGLYLNGGRTQPWGYTPGVNVLSGSGIGASVPIEVFGRIPAQPNPPSGTYTDTVVVTITY